VTGGSLDDPKENDLTRLNAGMSHTGVHKGGEARKVKAKDVIIVPAGMAHRFSELDGPDHLSRLPLRAEAITGGLRLPLS